MVKIIKLSHPDCVGCNGDPRECAVCTRAEAVTMCMNCACRDKSVMYREKLLCTKLHAWVEPYEFCAWGEVEE